MHSDDPNDQMIKLVIEKKQLNALSKKFKEHSTFLNHPCGQSWMDVGWLADVFGLRGSLKQLTLYRVPQQLMVF